MPELVALALPAHDGFVRELTRIWDDGDAVLPIDLRLPASAQLHLLETLGASRLVDPSGSHQLAHGRATDDGDALVMATSGTTGAPKGAVITHASLDAAAVATSSIVGADPERDTWLCCLPPAHMGGMGVITRALRTGTPLVMHDGFDATRVEGAARAGASLVSLVPTAMRRIDTSLFRTIVLGGSAIPPDRPANSVATYGLTETCGGVVYDRTPLDGVQIRTSPDGEIELRCPMLLRCYRDGSDPKTPDGWFPTGDLGSIDGGVLSVHGRSGDLIITGGENVWPAPIEAIIGTHPGVAAVAVVGRPDPEWGQVVTAVIEPDSSKAQPELEELRAMVREQLPAFCAPKHIEFAVLPKTALGKVRRSRL